MVVCPQCIDHHDGVLGATLRCNAWYQPKRLLWPPSDDDVQVFVHRVRKYLGAYLLHLDGRADAIVFSAGIGENAAGVRSAVCANLHGMGIEIDEDANRVAGSHARCVSTSGSRIKVLVVPTDEELCIAQDTARLASL